MPSQKFALEQGGNKRLEISWKGLWKSITSRMDYLLFGVIPNQKELREGREFKLLDGTALHIQLVQGLASSELRVLRDGAPLPGTGSDPRMRLKQAYGVLYFIGALNLLAGALAGLFRIQFLQELGFGWISAGFGIIFLLLAFLVQKQSLVALWTAILLFCVDILLSLLGGGFTVPNLLMRILFLILMIGGIRAIKDLKEERNNSGLILPGQ